VFLAEYSSLRKISSDCENRRDRRRLERLAMADSEGILKYLLTIANRQPGEHSSISYKGELANFYVVSIRIGTKDEAYLETKQPRGALSVGLYLRSFKKYAQLLDLLSTDGGKRIYLLAAGNANTALAQHLGSDFEIRHAVSYERLVHKGTIETMDGNMRESVVVALARKGSSDAFGLETPDHHAE
jgi:hypothetical protein